MRPILVLVAVTAVLQAGCALAPDLRSDDALPSASYPGWSLGPALDPDPALMSVTAGGADRADRLIADCKGYIDQGEGVRMNWAGAGTAGRLRISVVSNADTVLVVQAPDTRFACDDDSGEDANPSLDLPAMDGRYTIWIGTYSENEIKKSVLSVSPSNSF